jgi:hypothetical protein
MYRFRRVWKRSKSKKVEPMAAPRLTDEQHDALLTWLAAEYSYALIGKWFEKRGWKPLALSTLSYYRDQLSDEIAAARKARRDSALNRGLALKEERVQRLQEHADELEAIKWVADEKGRLWNEKAWRETLADIAAETGGRKQISEHIGPNGGAIETVNYTAEEWAQKRAARLAQAKDAASAFDDEGGNA